MVSEKRSYCRYISCEFDVLLLAFFGVYKDLYINIRRIINPSFVVWYREKLAFSSPRNQPSTLFAARCILNSSILFLPNNSSRSYTIK